MRTGAAGELRAPRPTRPAFGRRLPPSRCRDCDTGIRNDPCEKQPPVHRGSLGSQGISDLGKRYRMDGVTGSAAVTVTDPVPASIAIAAVTQGGLPADLENLSGVVFGTLNVQQNDETVIRVQLVLGGDAVAAQDFDGRGPGGPMEIVLAVDTRVASNGADNLEASLFTQASGLAEPAASTSLGITIQNPEL